MADDKVVLALAVYCMQRLKKSKKRRKRSIWVKPYLAERTQKSNYHLVQDLSIRLQDKEEFRAYLRMDTASFTELLEKVSPKIAKKTTIMREPITPGERLSITLRYLATGESFKSLGFQFRVHWTTVCKIIPEVLEAIFATLEGEYFNIPSTKEEWLEIAAETDRKWDFPNSYAAADGKHIAIKKPDNSGGMYKNYKGFFSIVLLAFVTHDYKIVYADVGAQGKISDGGVFRDCSLNHALAHNLLNLPPPRPLPKSDDPTWLSLDDEDEVEVPFVFVADSAFPLTKYCMKPYPEKNIDDRKGIFNYRLSRFRRISENAFGILVNIFGIFRTTIDLDPDTCIKLVLAAVTLHNMLRTKSDAYKQATDQIVEDGIDEMPLLPLEPRRSSNSSTMSAKLIREHFADYCYGPGAVSWQWSRLC